MNRNDLLTLGIPADDRGAHKLAYAHMKRLFGSGSDRAAVEDAFRRLIADPSAFLDDPDVGPLAMVLLRPGFVPREAPAPWAKWGGDDLEAQSVAQMTNACALPISVAGALMPDAHVGYGLPIGGVLATEGAVIPYAVGVDIACRMRLSVFPVPAGRLAGMKDRLANALESETRFGIGADFADPHDHDVMDDDWTVSPITRRARDRAWKQLGTSGSGNHFVEFGDMTLTDPGLGPDPGEYLALLSHSGSRGTGAKVCDHYSRIAIARHANLPKALKQLAWLDLDDEAGREYWQAMNLMGRYAAANHECIHRAIARKLGFKPILEIENHHNFAWEETHEIDGQARNLIVHRKGATPAGEGVMGIIPGSMTAPGFLVRGRGNPVSLRSASHGAGRVMSRTKARNSFTWSAVRKQLAEAGVTLLSAGIDEVPGVYKDIHKVMAAQTDLVDVLGEFQPRIVKMADGKDRAED